MIEGTENKAFSTTVQTKQSEAEPMNRPFHTVVIIHKLANRKLHRTKSSVNLLIKLQLIALIKQPYNNAYQRTFINESKLQDNNYSKYVQDYINFLLNDGGLPNLEMECRCLVENIKRISGEKKSHNILR